MKIEIIGDRKMLDFIKKYKLKMTMTVEIIHIQDEEGSRICLFDMESSSLRIRDDLSLTFVDELTTILKELVW